MIDFLYHHGLDYQKANKTMTFKSLDKAMKEAMETMSNMPESELGVPKAELFGGKQFIPEHEVFVITMSITTSISYS